MSFNFTGVQSMRIPEGVVTKITDASERVLWNAMPTDRAVLAVAKQTITTYAGETTYNDEQVVLLDIYPRKGGKVQVTYGGLTKTITDDGTSETPNAQQVFFGTFNGVSDSTATPDSGTLTIEGNFMAYGCGAYSASSKPGSSYCPCITDIIEWGEKITDIGIHAFHGCTSLALTSLPERITSIGIHAFHGCTSLTLTSLPSGITSISDYAFASCTGLTSIAIPENVTSIGEGAFKYCTGLTSISGLKCATIGEGAFEGCYALSSIPLEEGVISIGSSAFNLGTEAETTAFRSDSFPGVVIPSTVQSIGDKAFVTDNTADYDEYMSNLLKKIQLLPQTPPTLGDGLVLEDVFGYPASSCQMIVPAGCTSAYLELCSVAGWRSCITEVS